MRYSLLDGDLRHELWPNSVNVVAECREFMSHTHCVVTLQDNQWQVLILCSMRPPASDQ